MLLVLFVALKLTGVIGWSWWWVLSPILIPIGLLFGSILAIVLTGIAYVVWPSRKSKTFIKSFK